MFRRAGTLTVVVIVVLLGVAMLWAESDDPPGTTAAEAATGLTEADAPESEAAEGDAPDGEAAEGDGEEAAEEVKTFTVEAVRLKIEVPLDGVFEAAAMFPVSIVPEVWGNLEVQRAVPAGTVVSKGDPILWLDTEDIDRQIAETQAGQKLAELQMTQAETELAFLERSTGRNLEWARRAARITQEDHDRWVVITEGYREEYQPLDERAIHLRHEAAVKELEQLREMYEADELIEATEEMILKRNEYYAERAEVDYKVQKKSFVYSLELNVPRERQQRARSLEDSEIALEKAEIMLPLQLAMKQEQLAKARRDRERALEKFAELQADRELMVVNAPADGVVYYGECVRGQWTSGGGMEAKLKEGGHIGSREVFMTIVQPEEMIVRAGIGEDNLYEIAAGRTVSIKPTGYPEDKITGRVSDVLVAPSLAAKYMITVSLNATDSPVLPGMTCKLKVLVVDKPDALMVPATAVQSEDDEPDEKFVYLHVPDGEPEKRSVEVGRTKGDEVEVLQGLVVGDVILADKPAEEDGDE